MGKTIYVKLNNRNAELLNGRTQQTGTFLLIFHFSVHIIFLVIQKTAIKKRGTAMLNLACGYHAVKSVCVCYRHTQLKCVCMYDQKLQFVHPTCIHVCVCMYECLHVRASDFLYVYSLSYLGRQASVWLGDVC